MPSTDRAKDAAIAADQPLDPDAWTSREDLGRALTALRENSDLTVRTLADRVRIPPGTLGGYLKGRHLPPASQHGVFVALLRACGLSEDEEIARWSEGLRRVRAGGARRVPSADPPYRGLEAFRAEDAEQYFGRDALVAEVLDRLAAVRAGGRPALVPVIGASGSGKSSLLHAGVVVRLRERYPRRPVLVASVATDPARTWASIEAAAGDGLVVVLDQFEDVFAAVPDPVARRRFLDQLAGLDARRVVVLLGLRADFFPVAMAQPALVPALRENQVLVTPMSGAQLRDAIIAPAHRAGLAVEDRLVDAVLADLAPTGQPDHAHSPGALPLMSHALLATWQRATDGRLRLADYQAAGGIAGAVQQSAEEAYLAVAPLERDVVRRMFVRMANVDDETAVVGRRIHRVDLDELAPRPVVERVVATFVERRLLTAGVDTLQISHEALLTAWPRLREWIATDREGLRLHHRLTEDAAAWLEADRDETLLLAGGRLATTAEWNEEPDHERLLNRAERDYLATSITAQVASHRKERRQNRRLKQLLAVVAVLAMVTSIVSVVAYRALQRADRDRRATRVARDEALSREVAGNAARVAVTSPNLAAQLSLAALHIAVTMRARSAVLDSTARAMPTAARTEQRLELQALQFSRARDLVAAAGRDGTVHLWRLGRGPVPTELPPLTTAQPSDMIYALAFSPGGRTLFAGGAAGAVTEWDMTAATPRRVATISGLGGILALAVSRDGTRLAVGGDDGVRRYRLDEAHLPTPVGEPLLGGERIQAVAFDRSGRHLAAGDDQGAVTVLDPDAPAPSPEFAESLGGAVFALTFAPDGTRLAAAGSDRQVHIWRLRPGQEPVVEHVLARATSQVNALAYRSDGKRILVGSSDEATREYDTSTGSLVRSLPHPRPVTAVLYASGRPLDVGSDGTVRIWSRRDPTIRGPDSTLVTIGQAANAALMVLSFANGEVELWESGERRRLATLPAPAAGGAFDGSASIAPNGRLAAAGTAAGAVYLADIGDPLHPRVRRLPDSAAPTAQVEKTTFSPDATIVAAAGGDATMRLWDVRDASRPREFARLTDATGKLYSPTISHDGRYLAAACEDGYVDVWRLNGYAIPKLVARLDGFGSSVLSTAFSPTSDVLAAANTKVRLFEVHDDDTVTPLRELTGSRSEVYGLAFSADGQRIAAASQDSQVYVWDVAGAAPFAVLQAADSPVWSVSFTPDGRLLAGASDGTVHTWLINTAEATAAICGRAGTSVAPDVWAQYIPGEPYDPPCE